MASLVQPSLVNEPFGDPGLYVDFRFGRRALLFDLGDLQALVPRKLFRVSHVFVSHMHLDHFNGFDRLLRVCLGRPTPLSLVGPAGFIDRLQHKLSAYTWNLVVENAVDFVITGAEFDGQRLARAAEFHSREGFRRCDLTPTALLAGVLLDEENFQVRSAVLDHGVPSLAFAFAEKLRVNIWKDRLARLGLAVGPWVEEIKKAIRRGDPDETPVAALRTGRHQQKTTVSLGELRAAGAFRLEPGEVFAYVVDVSYHEHNAAGIVELARGARTLFIEAVFLNEDAHIAALKRHLTTVQAGALARKAGVGRVVPFHFSPRYLDDADRLRRETEDAFTGIIGADTGYADATGTTQSAIGE